MPLFYHVDKNENGKYCLSEGPKFLTNYCDESSLVGLDDRIVAVTTEIEKSGTWIHFTMNGIIVL